MAKRLKINPKVKAIAHRVRDQLEKFAVSDASKDYWFHGCTDMECMCELASYALIKVLQDAGFKPTLISGDYLDTVGDTGHFWVRWNGWVIDLTLTQFDENKDRVYIDRTKNAAYHQPDGFRSSLDFRSHMFHNKHTLRKTINDIMRL